MKNLLLILLPVLFLYFAFSAWAENNNISLCEKEGNVKICSQLCDAGNGSACYKLGRLYIYDGKKGIKQDYAKGLDSYQKACDAKYVLACTDLAELYQKEGLAGGILNYNKSIGAVKRDLMRAIELYQKACDLGDIKGCSELAQLFENGSGIRRTLNYSKEGKEEVPKDELKAKNFIKKQLNYIKKTVIKEMLIVAQI